MDPVLSFDDFNARAASIEDGDEIVDVLHPDTSVSASSSSSPSSAHLRGSYRVYTWAFKRYCVQIVLGAHSLKISNPVQFASSLLNVPHETLSDWMHFRGFDPDQKPVSKRERKQGGPKPKLNAKIENEIAIMIRCLRKRKKRVSMRLLRLIAGAIALKNGIAIKGSQVFLHNFCIRNGFRYYKRKKSVGSTGVDPSISIPKYLLDVASLTHLYAFDRTDIISADEFAVVFSDDNNKTVVDLDTMDRDVESVAKGESHVTAVCAANATGEWERVMLIFQGTGKRVPVVNVPSGVKFVLPSCISVFAFDLIFSFRFRFQMYDSIYTVWVGQRRIVCGVRPTCSCRP